MQPRSKLSTKIVGAWCCYDFANSIYYAAIPATIWSAYYANNVVGNSKGLGDLWWGRAVSLAMLIVALSSPVIGAIADYKGVRKYLLIIYTLLSALATCLLAAIGPGMIVAGFLLSVISLAAMEGALVFYNAYLPQIAPDDYQGRVSSWGFALGYVGSLAGLAIVLPSVRSGNYGLAFFFVGLAMLSCALPAFYWLPADRPVKIGLRDAGRIGIRHTWETFRTVARSHSLKYFLLAYFFYEDGVNTVINFAAVFAATTLSFTPVALIAMFIVVQISALLGSLIWAGIIDRRGPKLVLLIMLLQWTGTVTLAYFVQTKTAFFAVAVLAGSGLGPVQAASRAFMSQLIPAGAEARYFALYALCGKSASIIGPLIFGAISRHTGGNQRLAILSIAIIYLLGAVILSRVRSRPPS